MINGYNNTSHLLVSSIEHPTWVKALYGTYKSVAWNIPPG